MVKASQYENRGRVPFIFNWFSRKGPATFGKDHSPNIGDWGTVGCQIGFGAKSENKAMGNGLYLKKGSNIARVETDGQGLYLKLYKGSGLGMVGDGLYLKQGGQVVSGHGLLFGPNSPLKNITVLGWLL